MASTDVLFAPRRAVIDRPWTDVPVRPAVPRRRPVAPAVGAVVTVALLAVPAATTGLGVAGWLAGVAYAVALGTVLTLALLRGTGALGPADHVTLVRAVLTGVVTALVVDTVRAGAPLALLVSVASVALALDAVDGLVARRTGTASQLGARFDMEVDAFLILVLSVLAAESLGAWVLAIGLMRYGFVAASRALPWLRAPLPPGLARKTVAALQGIVLTVAAAGVLPHPVAMLVTGLALAALVWSFARDTRWLHTVREPSYRR